MVGGWSHWVQGTCHEDSYAKQIAPPEHWDVRDIIAIVADKEKPVSSTEGHRRALTSPLFPARLARVKSIVPRVRDAIYGRDFGTLGMLAESEALSMHAVMLTSAPPLLYWLPATVELLNAVWAWRAEGVPCYFTLDAGPNVHILTLPEAAEEIERRLGALPCVQRILACGPGPGPRVHAHEKSPKESRTQG
jgi:diphosphomevalonate decarboxylase